MGDWIKKEGRSSVRWRVEVKILSGQQYKCLNSLVLFSVSKLFFFFIFSLFKNISCLQLLPASMAFPFGHYLNLLTSLPLCFVFRLLTHSPALRPFSVGSVTISGPLRCTGERSYISIYCATLNHELKCKGTLPLCRRPWRGSLDSTLSLSRQRVFL